MRKMSDKKQIRSTNKQLATLVAYMTLNKNFANGEYSGPLGSQKIEVQWLQLKELLKKFGPDKSIEQWKQTWRDLKRKARRYNASEARSKTGENEEKPPVISDSWSLISDAIGHKCSTGISLDESSIGQNELTDTQSKERTHDDPLAFAPEFPTAETSTPEPQKKKSRLTDLSSIFKNFSQLEKEEDEFDIFGKYIATQLRKLSTEQAILGKEEIHKVVTKCRLNDLRYSNTSVILQAPGPSSDKFSSPASTTDT